MTSYGVSSTAGHLPFRFSAASDKLPVPTSCHAKLLLPSSYTAWRVPFTSDEVNSKKWSCLCCSSCFVCCSLDLKDIKVVTKLGGTVDDSEMVDGMVFDHKAAKSAGGPTRIENAKIGLIQFQISPPKTDLENNVIISDYAQMDRILKEERNYILQMIKKIRATGCNVLLIQKSILRDAVTELSLHYLVRLH